MMSQEKKKCRKMKRNKCWSKMWLGQRGKPVIFVLISYTVNDNNSWLSGFLMGCYYLCPRPGWSQSCFASFSVAGRQFAVVAVSWPTLPLQWRKQSAAFASASTPLGVLAIVSPRWVLHFAGSEIVKSL